MKTTVGIGFALVAYVTLAAAQEGPLQVWLLTLAPFALIAIALLLYIADHRNSNHR